MYDIFKRARSLYENMLLLGPIMGYLKSMVYLIKTQGDKDAIATAKYRGINFSFRRRDISAVKEVLKNSEYGFLKKSIEGVKNPVVLDIGAHIGLFSIWALSVNSGCKICSIEASPHTYKILSSNINNTKQSDLSWKSYHRAAWGESGEISFIDESESTMSHRVGHGGSVSVKTITLDELAELYGCEQIFDLVKIDIEGAEESFVCNARLDFSRFKNIAIEIHPDLCDTKKVEKILNDNFFVVNIKQGKSSSKPLLYCTR